MSYNIQHIIALRLWTFCRSTLKAKFRTDKRCEESSCRDRCGWEHAKDRSNVPPIPPTKLPKFPLQLDAMEMIEMLYDEMVMLGEISDANSA